VEKGAILASSPAEAAKKSESTIVCVSDHVAFVSVIHNDSVATAFEGKCLIQLGVVTTAEAQDAANWAQAHGIGYLEGSILGLPISVAAGEATIVCSGSREQYDEQNPILEVFGSTHHLSDSIGAAYQFDKMMYPFGFGAYLGFIQGAAMAKASGYSIETYTNILLEWMKPLSGKLENFGSLIRNEDFTAHQASLEVWVDVYEKSLGVCQSLEVDDGLPNAHMAMLRKGIADGYGEEEIIAIYKSVLPK
jgi:3-hydroxyisobutyrate dehydrogenase-like beta-hydroxyacid dehydrogenase